MHTIGEIKSYKELGYKTRYLRIWVKCPDCNKERWVALPKTKQPDYTGCCSICIVRRPDKWNVPFRKDIVNPQIGDLSKLARYRGVDIFSACPTCGKGRWCRLSESNRVCYDCGRVVAHLHTRRSIESKFPTRLSNAIRSNIRDALHRKGGDKKERGWENLVGYSIRDLMKHLQKQFKDGMSWDNYGEWHIDHIIPVSKFNFISTDDFDFKRCWTLSNLQPLWASENARKHAKYSKPFQPSLKLENKNIKADFSIVLTHCSQNLGGFR